MKKDNGGYLTVEAALAVSVLILCIYAAIMAFIILYQEARLKAVAIQAARSASDILAGGSVAGTVRPEKELYGDLADLFRLSRWEYRCLIDAKGEINRIPETNDASGTAKMLESAACIAAEKLKNNVIKPLSTQLLVRLENGLLKKEITVEIEQELEMPFGALKKLFGGSSAMVLSVRAVSSSSRPASFIRNVDLAAELVRSSLPLSPDGILERLKTLTGGLWQ